MDTRGNPTVLLRAAVMLLALTLVGAGALACETIRPAATPLVAPTHTVRPPTLPPTATATPVPASSPPTPRPTQGGPFSCNVTPHETITATELLQDVILFTRQVTSTGGDERPLELWAISTDGQRLGRVSAAHEGIAAYMPPAGSPALVLLMTSPLCVEDGRIRVLELPPECRPPAAEPFEGWWQPCSDFDFSPDGRLAAFRWGEYGCAERMGTMAIDLATGQTWTWPRAEVGWAQFRPDGWILVIEQDCEGGQYLNLWDPENNIRRDIGGGYEIWWNADETAVATAGGSPYWGTGSSTVDRFVEVHDLTTNRGVGSYEGENQDPCWAPDEDYLVYQHRALTYTERTYPETFAFTVTFGPREVHRVDMGTMQSLPLAADARYDYHMSCRAWKGEWVIVWRMPFQPRKCVDWNCDPCLNGPGEGCPPAERLALNVRTGELRPWDDASLPPLQPTPTPWPTRTPTPVPWPNLRAPVYADPAGRYGLYVGMDGRSLWCVQPGQAPVEWVEGGEVFFYVP